MKNSSSSELSRELREPMLKWLFSAGRNIDDNLQTIVFGLRHPRWYSTKDGSLKKFPVTVSYKYPDLDKLIFHDNAEWKEIVALVERLPQLKRHVEGMIGTAYGMRRRYSLEELFRFSLPLPYPISDTQVQVDGTLGLEQNVDNFLTEISSDSITSTIAWPILGLATPTPLDLEEGVTFRALNSEEKLACLNIGMIASSYDHEFKAEESEWFALVWEYESPKFGNEFQFEPDKINSHAAFQQELLEDFLICGCLINDRIVSHAGGVQHAPSIEIGGAFSGGVVGRAVQNGNMAFRFKDEGSMLSDAEGARFVQLWKFIRQHKSTKQGRQVVNAARRLHYSETRVKAEDVLVDLMVAAESLYLDGEDKGELSFRLSLNASLWDANEPKDRKETFLQFRRAYSLRSKVVHGAKLTETEVPEVVSLIRPKLKKAVLKSLDQVLVGAGAPKWDDILFATNANVDESVETPGGLPG